MRPRPFPAATAALLLLGSFVRPAAAAPDLASLRLPPGFAIEIWASGVGNARSMALGTGGTLFVGTRTTGIVHAITDEGGQRRVHTIARGLTMPNGVAFRDGALYVGELTRVLRDDVPACELNRLSRPGQHFGFPFCHAGDVPDPEFGSLGRCADAAAPALKLGPHVAPLGLRFYDGRQFPGPFRGSLFIAEHGSWNRSEKSGYRVMRVRMNGSRPASYEEFASGWLRPDGTVTGRPVDLLVLADGSMLLSDDVAGVVYRITYRSST